MSEIVKSEYNALGEDNNYKTHYFKTSADQVVGLGRMKNTEYQVGDVVYSDTNNKVALKCTTAGTTSNAELDISGKAVGESVTDGGVVWSVVDRISDSVPIGQIAPFAMNEHPAGWLACDGTAVSRIVYADLFAVIGTTYGAGDGSTTFNLPNLNNNSFLEGSNTAGTVKSAGLPNITGQTLARTVGNDNILFAQNTEFTKGAFDVSAQEKAFASNMAGSSQASGQYLKFNASRSNAIYGNSNTVQPKSVTVKFCIKAYGAITNAGSVELENAMKAFENLQTELDKEAGFIKPYAGDVVPSGYLPCNGSELSRSTYARLFSIIGTTYGSGDGSTTFNLPNAGNKLSTDNLTLTGNARVISAYDGGLHYLFGYENDAFGSYGIGLGFYKNTDGYGNISGVTAGGGFIPGLNLISSMVAKMSDVSINAKSVTVKYCIKY